MRGPLAAAILALQVTVLAACKEEDPKPAPALQPAAPAVPNEADDTVGALSAFYPAACQAAAVRRQVAQAVEPETGKCAYDSIVAAVEQGETSMRNLQAALPKEKAQTACGKMVEANVKKDVTATLAFLNELREWMRANEKAAKRKIVADNKLAGSVPGAPMAPIAEYAWDPKTDPSGTKPVRRGTYNQNDYECTKALFQCGQAADNICWVNKVVERLGLACDPKNNKTSGQPNDMLRERATGRGISPVRR